ncbi:MAG: hypothetical protein M1570_13120, partial [Chloroflexi bacterium]|nr:hypothetical protein [Chloroflexota bacterium]
RVPRPRDSCGGLRDHRSRGSLDPATPAGVCGIIDPAASAGSSIPRGLRDGTPQDAAASRLLALTLVCVDSPRN